MKLFLVIALFSGCSDLFPTGDAAASDAGDAAVDATFTCVASGAVCSGDYPCCVGGCIALAGIGSVCQ